MKCNQSFMCRWFPSDSSYYRNGSVLPFVLNIILSFFSKSSKTIHNETFKFCITHVSLAADEVLRKFNSQPVKNE